MADRDFDALAFSLVNWPTAQTLSLALTEFGPLKFSEICPELDTQFASIAISFIDLANRELPLNMLKRVIARFLEDHSRPFEFALMKLATRTCLDADEIETLFAPPFQFVTSEVFARVLQSRPIESLQKLLSLVDRAKIAFERIAVLCTFWRDGWSSLEFFARVGTNFSDDDAFRIVGVLPKMESGVHQQKQVLEACCSVRSLTAFLQYLDRHGDPLELASETVLRLLCCDRDIEDSVHRVEFYIEVTKIIGGLLRLQHELDVGMIGDVIGAVHAELKMAACFPLFPLAPPAVFTRWSEILSELAKSSGFAPHAERIEKVLQLIEKIVCKIDH
jgi:hypothetical protein